MKIACVLGPKFEDSEFNEPYDAFRKAGHEVTIVGLEAGAEIEGDKGKVKARVDKSFTDVKADDFDALLIPGGGICHGPQLLLAADEYKNHRMTAWKTIQDDLKKAGANVVDQEVVVDRNLVTSRQPSDISAFIRESLKALEQVPARR